jgi:5-methylcytosine-specific restriction endonuclease McrA
MTKLRTKNKQELPSKSGVKKKRIKKAAKKRVSRVVKTRNHETMTEAAFFNWIKNSLRSRSRFWRPISACKQNAKRPYKGVNKRQKFEYQCNLCKNWFSDKETAVDHIIPVGSLKSFEDLPGVVERLFCEIEGLQVLCSNCHTEKTKQDLIQIRQ